MRRNLLEVDSEPPGEAGEVVQRLGGKLRRGEARGVPDEVVVEDELANACYVGEDTHGAQARVSSHVIYVGERHTLQARGVSTSGHTRSFGKGSIEK